MVLKQFVLDFLVVLAYKQEPGISVNAYVQCMLSKSGHVTGNLKKNMAACFMTYFKVYIFYRIPGLCAQSQPKVSGVLHCGPRSGFMFFKLSVNGLAE